MNEHLVALGLTVAIVGYLYLVIDKVIKEYKK